MRLGVGLPKGDIGSVMRYASTAEELGFDSVVTADHIFMENEALTILTAVAMKTRRIRICSLVLDGNRRDPTVLAHITSTLDRISTGRLILGVGKGVFNEPSYFYTVNKPVSRMLEAIQVLKKLWTEDEVSYSGDFFSYNRLRLNSKPLQKPHPPLWIAAFGSRMFRIAAEIADGFITQNMPPEMFKQCVKKARGMALKVGRDPDKMEAVYGLNPVAVSQDGQRARKLIDSSARSFILRHSKRLSRELGYDKAWSNLHEIPEEVIDACFTFGTSEDCANKIRDYLNAGATYIILQTILPKGIDSLRKVAEDLFRK